MPELFLPGLERFHFLNKRVRHWREATYWVGAFFEKLTTKVIKGLVRPEPYLFQNQKYFPDLKTRGMLVEVKATHFRKPSTAVKINEEQFQFYLGHLCPTLYCLWFYERHSEYSFDTASGIFKSVKNAELFLATAEDVKLSIESLKKNWWGHLLSWNSCNEKAFLCGHMEPGFYFAGMRFKIPVTIRSLSVDSRDSIRGNAMWKDVSFGCGED